MSTTPKPRPDALAELRELGYEVRTYEEALDAAELAFGVSRDAAVVFVAGRTDLDGPDDG